VHIEPSGCEWSDIKSPMNAINWVYEYAIDDDLYNAFYADLHSYLSQYRDEGNTISVIRYAGDASSGEKINSLEFEVRVKGDIIPIAARQWCFKMDKDGHDGHIASGFVMTPEHLANVEYRIDISKVN
jgi:hypothetical protein